MLEMEKLQKSSRRTKSSHNGDNFTNAHFLPTSVVCRATPSQPGAVEAGLVLSAGIVLLYLFGFYETIISLPDETKPPAWSRHMGQNLNLAVPSEWDTKPPEVAVQQQHLSSRKANEKKKSAKSKLGDALIPEGIWPVSIKNESNDYETLIHPGDQKTALSVPKFWSAPVHNNRLFSREDAMKIGTCIEPDSNGNYVRGDKCPVEKRTIYVGIASYRDFQCRLTVESIFGRARFPERIRVGVVDQIVPGEDVACNEPVQPCDKNPEQALCKYKDRVDVFQMEAELSIGPVFARHIGYRLYRGEYYATQSDAHVTYTLGWDVDIIEQLEVTKNDMAVLTTYLTDIQGSLDPQGHSLRRTRPIMCNTVYEGGPQGMHLRHASQPERMPSVHGTPQLQPWWAAGYSFSRGHFIVNVPYDPYQPMIFQGEEMSIGIRGFTIGYDYYAPERSVCFHHYATGKNAVIRNKVPHFWENDRKYAGTGKRAMARLLGIVHMNPETDPKEWDHTEEDRYGIGKVRTPEKFYEVFGINTLAKTIEEHLCSFVDGSGGRMHHMFTPMLRSDGMGIDYSKINYRFKDPGQPAF